MRRWAVAAAAAFAFGLVPSAVAQETPPLSQLLSRPDDGGAPNGPSFDAAISQDRQTASIVAFASQASNLVPDDGNGSMSDVFVVRRANPFADRLRGLPWAPAGPPQLVSRGLGGAPANGPSYGPDLDGDQVHDGLDARGHATGADSPHCVAFVSAASNLVPGDTNGYPDAFVADLRTGRIQRVSVDTRGRQADGPTFDVQVDGGCRRVAFTADAPRLAFTKSEWKRARRPAAWRPLVTAAPPRGRREVYVRSLAGARVQPLTFLASARRGRPANGASYDVSLGDFGQLAYTSEASNLAAGDHNGAADVYELDFRDFAKLSTTLVSRTRAGEAGNGPSIEPSIASGGRFVAFATDASDILPCARLDAGTVCDTNGVRDVAVSDTRAGRWKIMWASASAAVGLPGNAPSDKPSMTRYGATAFQSDATDLQRNPLSGGRESDRNGATDVFFWSLRTRGVSLQSRDSFGEPLKLAEPSGAPAVSAYNNYIAFESWNPFVDRTVVTPASVPQVYLRYVGRR